MDKIHALQTESVATNLRFDHLKESLGNQMIGLKSDIAALDAKFEAKFITVDTKFQALDTKFQAIDTKFQALDTKIETKFQALDTKIDTKFVELLQQQNRIVWRVVFFVVASGVIALGSNVTTIVRDHLQQLRVEEK